MSGIRADDLRRRTVPASVYCQPFQVFWEREREREREGWWEDWPPAVSTSVTMISSGTRNCSTDK